MWRAGLGSKRRSRVEVRVWSGAWGREEIGGREGAIILVAFGGLEFAGFGICCFLFWLEMVAVFLLFDDWSTRMGGTLGVVDRGVGGMTSCGVGFLVEVCSRSVDGELRRKEVQLVFNVVSFRTIFFLLSSARPLPSDQRCGDGCMVEDTAGRSCMLQGQQDGHWS